MSVQHTQGRLRLFQVGDHLEFLCPATEDGESILTITHEGNTQFAVVLKDADARRLVACWNACDGIPTEVLESQQSGGLPWMVADQIDKLSDLAKAEAQRDELLAALKDMATAMDAMGDMPDGLIHPLPWRELRCEDLLAQARAAIAKVEGGAA